MRVPGPRRERKSLLEVMWIHAEFGARPVRGAVRIPPRAYWPDLVGPLPVRETFAPEAVLRLSF